MKAVYLSKSKEQHQQRCWHFVSMLLLFAFAIGSISANQSASRLVRQAGQVAATDAVALAANTGIEAPLQPPINLGSLSQQQQKQKQALPTTSISPPSALPTTTTTTTTTTPTTTSSTMSTSTSTSPSINKQQQSKPGKNDEQNQQCEYEKEAWQACQSNGVQERILRLKRGLKCEPVKIMRRECRIGCKYARGEWSNTCNDGLRVRVDTLIGYTNPNELETNSINGQPNTNKLAQQKHWRASNTLNCQPERKVTKDCRRTCHYIKSAWSDCINGFKTRNLTLDETPLLEGSNNSSNGKIDVLLTKTATTTTTTNKPIQALSQTGTACIKQKQVRRECRRRELQNVVASASASTKLAQTTAVNSSTVGKIPLTPAQKRRFKQAQRQQQQKERQQQQQQQQQPPQQQQQSPAVASRTEVTTARSNILAKGRR